MSAEALWKLYLCVTEQEKSGPRQKCEIGNTRHSVCLALHLSPPTSLHVLPFLLIRTPTAMLCPASPSPNALSPSPSPCPTIAMCLCSTGQSYKNRTPTGKTFQCVPHAMGQTWCQCMFGYVQGKRNTKRKNKSIFPALGKPIFHQGE